MEARSDSEGPRDKGASGLRPSEEGLCEGPSESLAALADAEDPSSLSAAPSVSHCRRAGGGGEGGAGGWQRRAQLASLLNCHESSRSPRTCTSARLLHRKAVRDRDRANR